MNCPGDRHNWRRIFWWTSRLLSCVACGRIAVKTSQVTYSMFKHEAVQIGGYAPDHTSSWHRGA
jgi:hypothetical protein